MENNYYLGTEKVGKLLAQFAVGCLRIYLSLIIFTCVQKVCAIFLQSIGHAKAAAPLSVIRDVFLIVLSLIVPAFLGVTGIFWAAPAADILAIAITAAVMVRLWKQLNVSDRSAVLERTLPEYPTKQGVVVTISREHGSAGNRQQRALSVPMGREEHIMRALPVKDGVIPIIMSFVLTVPSVWKRRQN